MRNKTTVMAVASTVVLAGLVVALGLQNKTLGERYSQALAQVHFPYTGMYVPEERVHVSDGRDIVLGRPVDFQVLYFFNTGCPYCKASLPAVVQLNKELAQDERLEFVAVSQDSVPDTTRYFSSNSALLPFVSLPDRRALGLFHVGGVPMLVVIDKSGQVRFVHLGMLASRTMSMQW